MYRKLELMERLVEIEEICLSIPVQFGRMLACKTGGELLRKNSIHATVVIKDHLPFLVVFTEDKDVAIKLFNAMIERMSVKLDSTSKTFLASKKWKYFKTDVEKNCMLCITEHTHAVTITGIGDDVKKTAPQVEALLRENSYVQEAIPVRRGIGRFLQLHEQQLFYEIEKR